jgi:4-hydroxybenzoate polyprenyltransferase
VKIPAAGDVAALVRLPAALSVPGDVLLGAAMAGRSMSGRTLQLVGSSSLLYLAGMALNDWADREVDAQDRPQRPIPSGRVTPSFALGLAVGLTAAGIGVAAASGPRALAVTLPLAGAVWTYDLALKDTAVGPLSMASCRTLDVLVGARAGRLRAALPAAGLVGAHTLVLSTVSRREVEGAEPGLAQRAFAATVGVVAAGGVVSFRRLSDSRRLRRLRQAGAAGLLGAYAVALGRAELRAARKPNPANLQRIVATGILSLMPLEGALIAAAGPVAPAAAVAGAWPIARALARRRAVT